jgi:LPS O-antigen subunit length determinant protein (WzzB/FepE family)
MTETTNLMTNNPLKNSDNDIELMDYITIIWKWRKTILTGTIACILIAFGISYLLPKIYRITMTVRPGIIGYDNNGKRISAESSDNLSARIHENYFLEDLMLFIEKENIGDIPGELVFETKSLSSSNFTEVAYETPNVPQGMKIINQLKKMILEDDKKEIDHFYQKNDLDLQNRKNELKNKQLQIKICDDNIKTIAERIAGLNDSSETISQKLSSLQNDKVEKIQQKKNENTPLAVELYDNTISLKLGVINNYKTDIRILMNNKEQEQQKLFDLKNDVVKITESINDILFQKESIQYMKVISEPESGKKPVKPNMKLNLILSGFIGFFVSIFAVIIMESYRKYKS